MYWQGQVRTERELAERRERWETWSRTLYIGAPVSTYHPGLNLGSGSADTIQKYVQTGRLLWPDQAEFKPGLTYYNNYVAESWEMGETAEGRKFIDWKIKPDLKFQDGTPLNAEAIKYCWEQECFDMPYREKNKWTAPSFWHESAWDELVVLDDLTLRMYRPPMEPGSFKGFLPWGFVGLFSLDYANIYSPTSTEKYGLEDSPLEDFVNQVGFGPLKLDKWIPDERFEFVPWEDFPENPLGGYAGPDKITNLDRVVIVSYPDKASMRMALETGEIDLTIGGRSLAEADLEGLRNNPDVDVLYSPWLGGQQILHMNYAEEFAPLNDVRVRKAIQYVIDPDEVLDKLLFGTAEISHSPVRPIQPYYKPSLEPLRSLDYDERIRIAKELLTEAGYPEGFETELWYPTGGSAEFNRELGTILQAQLRKVGIEVSLEMIESAVYSDFRREGRLPMHFRGWTLDFVDPDSELFYMMHSASYYQTHAINFKDEHVDDLLYQGRVMYDFRGPDYDDPGRAAIYEELQDYIVEKGFCVPLYVQGRWDAKRTWVVDYKYWRTCDVPYQGIWNARKVIPDGWETSEPPN
jgi:peptide/nickel transport system substrate-binding protein